MNNDEIITFLEIIKQGSITKAAEALYISQGTASARIQSLEEKLGITLFYRQQGIRSILLTPQGEEFLDIARQYVSLCSEAEEIKHKSQYRTFHIACTDSINRLLSAEFYPHFIQNHPDIILSIYTEHAAEIYAMIDSGDADLGLGRSLHTDKNVTATPLYTEESVFLHHNRSEILPHNEIHTHYSETFEEWYLQHFPDTDHPRITIGTMSMMEYFLNEKDTWAIVQKSIAEELCLKNSDLVFQEIKDPYLFTTYYYHHTHLKPWLIPVIDLFLNELNTYLHTFSSPYTVRKATD